MNILLTLYQHRIVLLTLIITVTSLQYFYLESMLVKGDYKVFHHNNIQDSSGHKSNTVNRIEKERLPKNLNFSGILEPVQFASRNNFFELGNDWGYKRGLRNFVIERYWYDTTSKKIRHRKDYNLTIRKSLIDLGLFDASTKDGYPGSVVSTADTLVWGLHWENIFGFSSTSKTKNKGPGMHKHLIRERKEKRRYLNVQESKYQLLQSSDDAYSRLSERCLVNMVPGIVKTLTNKRSLSRTRAKKANLVTDEFLSFLPISFLVPEDYNEWANFIVSHPNRNQAWIFKPENTDEGKGIELFHASERKKVKTLRTGIIQEYIQNPLITTSRGVKLDLRCWGIITSLQPFSFFVLPDAHIRLANVPYSADKQYFNNKCMHVLNLKQGCRKTEFTTRINSIWTDQAEYELNQNISKLWRHKIVPVMINTVLLGLEDLRNESKRVLSNKGIQTFQFLSFDIIITDTGQVKLLEINADGYTRSGLQKIQGGEKCTEDMFKLVGAAPVSFYDRWRDTVEASAWMQRIRDYCQTQAIVTFEKCKEDIGKMVEENQHAGCWMRAYPIGNSNSSSEINESAVLVPLRLQKEDILVKNFLHLYDSL